MWEVALERDKEGVEQRKHKKKMKYKVKLSQYQSRKQVKKISKTRALKRVGRSYDGCTVPPKLHQVEYGNVQAENKEKLDGKLNVAWKYAKYAKKAGKDTGDGGYGRKLESDVREHRINIEQEGVQLEGTNESNPVPADDGGNGGLSRGPRTIWDIAIDLQISH